ncbi:RNA polymerase sigma factor [Thalassotalea eurytherma]|uniref:Sigma-24 n=1 Tax=Thalassotalea eurytherma TaxID=1144278 RepID=A0ABQ6H536_9GAMM|nr:sigma-70 family RNA polymerase sigma factor [Thalassotalea eurytherma]GLX82732.1 sigma-24 [Thalassotalea eurytherma]
MFERSDNTLIKHALKGKSRAWNTLVKRYEKPIYHYALRMVSHQDDALDLMQDIFIAVYRNLASFRGESPFKGWLFKIAHYRCIEYYRRKKPTLSLDESPALDNRAVDDCHVEALFDDFKSQRLFVAMQQLPVNQKLVVEMKFFQQFTFDEIASQLGISTNTVKSRVYSALDKLKLTLEVDYET